MVSHNLIILNFFIIILFLLFYLKNLIFFSDICGCNTICPYPITTPKNSIVGWKPNDRGCPICFFLFSL